MNNTILQEALNKQLTGVLIPDSDYLGWGKELKILNVIKSLFDTSDPALQFITVKKDPKEQLFTVKYKGLYVCAIRYTKTKGDYHYSWFGGSHTDYYFKDFTVTKEFDFTTIRKEIEEAVIKCDMQKRAKELKAKKVLKELQEKYGEETRSILDCINKNYYSFSREISEEQGDK